MLTAFRWLLRLFVGLIAVGLLTLGIAYYFLSRSLPDYNASYALSGIAGPVEIVRNNNDVPHIFAENDDDAYDCNAGAARAGAAGAEPGGRAVEMRVDHGGGA